MAARLPVVISQATQRDGHTVDFEEDFVARLMMTAGLDATLIAPLANLTADSTDLLCLQGLGGGFALVSWMDIDELRQHWQRLQLDGALVDMQVAEGRAPHASPKVYHFRITSAADADSILDSLKQLLQARNVPTIGISLPGEGRMASQLSDSAGPSARPHEGAGGVSANSQPPTSDQPAAESMSAKSTERSGSTYNRGIVPDAPAPETDSRSSADRRQWDELDRLMDDFDSLDL